jgi:hypothetical protein
MKKNILAKILMLLVISVFSLNCGMLGGAGNSSNADASPAKPQIGDMVIVRLRGSSYDATNYLAGKVQKIDGNKYEMLRNDNNTFEGDVADIYFFPKEGSKIDVKVGDIVVANSIDRAWKGGEVVSVNGTSIEIKAPGLPMNFNVTPDKAIRVSPEFTADIKKAIELFPAKDKK